MQLVTLTKIDVIDYRYAKPNNRSVEFHPLPFLSACDRTVDIFWEMYFRLNEIMPSWQGMMHFLHREVVGTVFPNDRYESLDKTCILSALDYLYKLASNNNMPTIITFD